MSIGQIILRQTQTAVLGLRRRARQFLVAPVALATLLSSCKHHDAVVTDSSAYLQAATAIETPELDSPVNEQAHLAVRPVSLSTQVPAEFREISLQEAVQISLANSKIFRDLGGIVLQSPESTRSTMDTAILETDPRFGPQAALSAFDATFAASVFYEKNDRALNNEFFGGGTRILAQEAMVYQTQISKRTPFGSQFTLRNNIDYDDNNAPGNQFAGAWNFNVEAEYRQSLLRGAGIDFGRIAGTSRVPGVYNGVLIARANTDVSVADFEISVRDFIDDVEEAYWNLYFSYRDLDTKIAARDAALSTWKRVQALASQGRIGGEKDKEAEAREQYYRFQEEVENALTGRVRNGTSPSGRGLHLTERRLRYLIGLPSADGALLRPSEEPTRAEVVFDWDLSLEESLAKRTELRRQKWMIKRRELELVASRNFLLPELDVVALSRWRGFGEDFARYDDPDRFGSALGNFADGDFQETQIGVELAFPLGNRQAHAAVRNAEFLLARERALLTEQEQRVVLDLSNAYAEVDRAYHVLQTVYNRREASRERVRALEVAFEQDQAKLDLVLDAQRRLADSESHYYDTLVEYNNSIREMHRVKGTLLEYSGIHLSEGPWPLDAYADGNDKLNRRRNRKGKYLPGHRVISAGYQE
ncbi:TolC family protein [Thalassoglobus polymorphus]|uniref:Outer membrane efflux protein n=1 Tax=Thalassoglobus polymorphus TaxID=2527994 RepID=A0A517QI06_9PLAN|nr:TolC family protein [Thalassoglobus polymorphus]QDT31262.1 Outer membrane efflux protein [Thalassoglobus polymorphus]